MVAKRCVSSGPSEARDSPIQLKNNTPYQVHRFFCYGFSRGNGVRCFGIHPYTRVEKLPRVHGECAPKPGVVAALFGSPNHVCRTRRNTNHATTSAGHPNYRIPFLSLLSLVLIVCEHRTHVDSGVRVSPFLGVLE